MKNFDNDDRAAALTRPASPSAWRWLLLSTVLLVGLLLSAGTARAAIQVGLERPASNFPSSGVGNVQGWAFTTAPGAKIKRLIEVQIDQEPVFYVPCCSSRGDVKAVYPSAPMLTGFSGAYNYQRLAPGLHDVKVTIRSTAGETKTITSSFEVVKVSSFKFLRSFHWSGIEGQGCESLPGLDPAHGNSGAVCNAGRAVSKGPGNPIEECEGTIQFAFDRATQTLMPVSGCDPQGTLGGGGNGGGNGGGGGGPTIGVIDPGLGGLTCLPTLINGLSIDVNGISPTFNFTTTTKSKAGFELWKYNDIGAGIQAIGTGPSSQVHSINPLPFVSKLEEGTKYFYRVKAKSPCSNKPDAIVEGTFTTQRRVARAYIDRVYVISDGDDLAAGKGELRFQTAFYSSTLPGGVKSNVAHFDLNDNTAVNSPVSTGWLGATENFTVGFLAGEFDPPNGGPKAEKKFSFSTTLTLPGGTWEQTITLQDSNMKVSVKARVTVSYE